MELIDKELMNKDFKEVAHKQMGMSEEKDEQGKASGVETTPIWPTYKCH